jgi:hypothetical protein
MKRNFIISSSKIILLSIGIFLGSIINTHASTQFSKDNIYFLSNKNTTFLFKSLSRPDNQIQTSILTTSVHQSPTVGQTFFLPQISLMDFTKKNITNEDSIDQKGEEEFIICNTKTSKNINYWEENYSFTVEVFPNPATQKLTIKIDSKMQNASCFIFNIAGDIVFKQRFENFSEQTVDISRFPDGIYFVRLDIQGQNIVRKFVKQ